MIGEETGGSRTDRGDDSLPAVFSCSAVMARCRREKAFTDPGPRFTVVLTLRDLDSLQRGIILASALILPLVM